MGEQPGGEAAPGLRQRPAAIVGHEGVGAAARAERLVQVPAAGEDVLQLRPAHEGRVIAVAGADLLGGAPEQHHRIRRLERGVGLEGRLDLARAELDLERAQLQAERRDLAAQHRKDRVELVEPDLGEILVAVAEQPDFRRGGGLPGRPGFEPGVEQLEYVELDLDAGQVVEPLRPEPGRGGAADIAGRAGDRPPVRPADVAEHPAGPRRPGQDAEGLRVGDHQEIRGAGEVGVGETGGEDRRHRAVRAVLDQQSRSDRHAVGERRIDRPGHDRLAAQNAVLVGEGEAHQLDAVLGDAAEHLRPGLALLLPPQPVAVDEARPPGRAGHAPAQADCARRRASTSRQDSRQPSPRITESTASGGSSGAPAPSRARPPASSARSSIRR